jgi:hypothetical protein
MNASQEAIANILPLLRPGLSLQVSERAFRRAFGAADRDAIARAKTFATSMACTYFHEGYSLAFGSFAPAYSERD